MSLTTRSGSTAMESKDNTEEISILLPDGRKLIAQAFPNSDYPCINIYLQMENGDEDEVCFAEFNPEHPVGQQVCVGAYRDDDDETQYYQPYETIK